MVKQQKKVSSAKEEQRAKWREYKAATRNRAKQETKEAAKQPTKRLRVRLTCEMKKKREINAICNAIYDACTSLDDTPTVEDFLIYLDSNERAIDELTDGIAEILKKQSPRIYASLFGLETDDDLI